MGVNWYRLVPAFIGFAAIIVGTGFRFGWDVACIIGGTMLLTGATLNVEGDNQ